MNKVVCLADERTLRTRALVRQQAEALAERCLADTVAMVMLLSDSLAIEIACLRRYGRSPAQLESIAGRNLIATIRLNLRAGRLAMEGYRQRICYLGDLNSPLSRLSKASLALADQQADELTLLLAGFFEGSEQVDSHSEVGY